LQADGPADAVAGVPEIGRRPLPVDQVQHRLGEAGDAEGGGCWGAAAVPGQVPADHVVAAAEQFGAALPERLGRRAEGRPEHEQRGVRRVDERRGGQHGPPAQVGAAFGAPTNVVGVSTGGRPG
jgi:hypothetical protein